MTWRRSVLVLLLALAEAALIAPLAAWLVPLPATLGPTGTLALAWAVLAALALQWQALAHFNVSLRAQRLLMGVWLIVLIVLFEADVFLNQPSLAPDVVSMAPGFIFAIVLWWRGMALGTSELHPRDAEARLQVGILLLMVFAVTTLFTRDEALLLYISAFFVGALPAAPLANLDLTERSRLGRRTPMGRSWWGWIAGTTVVVMVIALLITSLATGRSAAMLLGTLLAILLLPVVLLIALIPQSFFDALAAALRRLGEAFNFFPNLAQESPQQAAQQAQQITVQVPPAVNLLIAVVVFALLVGLVLIMMRRAERPGRFAPNLSADVDGNLAALNRNDGGSKSQRLSSLSLRRWLAAMTIRRLYARATHEAARRGKHRSAAQTPYDFLPSMQSAFPTAESDARAITEAYVAAHYGEVPDSQEALDALKQAWERMRATQR
jgi:hypothetical protein